MIDESRLYKIPIFNRPPLMDVPEWAKRNRYMQSTSAMFNYNQTPYLELPSHFMSDLAETSMVILKTPSQIGKTTAIENALGWMYTYCPSNTMLILDSLKSGMKMSHNRIRPFLRDCCGVNNPNNTSKKNPDKSNSIINIGLGSGASLFVCSSKSVTDLRSTPARFIFMDEVDNFAETPEGDPIDLALKRQMRFRGMACLTSTPTTQDGHITQYYLLGTQQTWGVVCECGEWFSVDYDNIDYTGSTPNIHCPHCGVVYNEEGIKALEHKYSEPANKDPYRDELGRIRRSFQITAPLCHEFYSWDGLKRAELAALQLGEGSYKAFRNTTLGEVYTPKDEMEIVPLDLAYRSQDDIDAYCLPQNVFAVTMGVDTHDNCLYAATIGWSEDGKHCYGIDYSVLAGDPDKNEPWQALTEKMNTIYTRVDGLQVRPSFCCVDCGGHKTNAVYRYSKINQRMLPIRGYVTDKKNAVDPLIGALKKVKFNAGIKAHANVLFLGVNAGKDRIQEMEIMTMSGEQRLHYPKGHGFDIDYFKGLTAERKIEGKWIAKSHAENEPLDTLNYAMAAYFYWYSKYYVKGKDPEYSHAIQVLKGEIPQENPQPIQENILDALSINTHKTPQPKW